MPSSFGQDVFIQTLLIFNQISFFHRSFYLRRVSFFDLKITITNSETYCSFAQKINRILIKGRILYNFMEKVKKLLVRYFTTLAYFYKNIGYRIVLILVLSMLIGLLDSLGLVMFLPLLKFASGNNSGEGPDMGKMNFLIDGLQYLGIPMTIMGILGVLAFFFISKGIIKYIASIYNVKVLQWFIRKLRIKLLKGLNALSYNYFVNSDIGRIQNAMTGEVARVVTSFTNYFRALQFLMQIIVYTSIAFLLDWKFAILVSIGGVLSNFLFKKIYAETKGASKKLSGGNNVFQSLIIQQVGNYKYLKATGTLKAYSRKLIDIIKYIQRTQYKIGKLNAIMTAAREPVMIIIIVAVIYIQILASLLIFYRALTYLVQMQTSYNKFLSMSGSLANVQDFEKELRENKEIRGKAEFEKNVETLKLENAYFYYGEHEVLSDINLAIEQNQSVAFVGESGSGKTTMVNVLVGLLPLRDGTYYINGENSEKLDIPRFQQKVGYITQDPVIFNDSIFNNVTFWDDPSDKNIDRFNKALRQAAIYDYVVEQTKGRDQVLGNNGINLSGGQRQRISIARELYKDIELLVLDEATSALDSETEKAIQENIDALQGQYTILMIAHRISTVKNADKIFVMNRGKILDSGSYKELLQSSKYFKRLVEFQDL